MAWYVNFSREAPTSRRCPSKKLPRSWICSITDPESASDLPPLLKCCTSLDNSPRRKPEERAPGALPPGPPVLWPLVSTRWFWGWLSLIRSRGDFLRYAKTDLGRIFQKKYAEKEFYERKSPNQGTYMGLVIAYRPERCGTTAKTSEWERAGPEKRGGGGPPPATLCVRAFSRESLDPPPGTGREPTSQGLTCAGPNRTTCRKQAR